MARKQTPPPGRLFVSVIYSHLDAVADAMHLLEKKFGRVHYETTDLPFTEKCYTEEMGSNLQRRLLAFDGDFARDCLAEAKDTCARIEEKLGDTIDDYTFRTANIDPGIISPGNVVISSYTEFNHRLYIGRGVFAEVVLSWSRGRFVRMPWTCPDFCHDEAIDLFLRVRNSFQFVAEEPIHR
jgi:hypothetical protein